MLQLDGYESYLNAQKIDMNGHIKEFVSPGDCTDLCSTVDQELGSFIKQRFNLAFKNDFTVGAKQLTPPGGPDPDFASGKKCNPLSELGNIKV